jgi:hypothetical protein
MSNFTSSGTELNKKHCDLRDAEIRNALIELLTGMHWGEADTVVLEEFGCNDARADLAVVNGVMHCYEIKSRFDKLDRLANQVPSYSGVFDQVTLVAANAHLEKARGLVPKWWGIMSASERNGEVILRKLRAARPNPSLNAQALASMLWKDEAYRLLRSRGLSRACEQKPYKRYGRPSVTACHLEAVS